MSQCSSPARHRYLVYGVRVTSDCPFEFPTIGDASEPIADVEFVQGTERDFQPFADLRDSSEPAFVCRQLAGGLTYLRWAHLYEFSVEADGSRVVCRPLDGCDRAVLQNFLFGQALAVALVQQGIEPLHAAVVRMDDCAVGFLGDCTFGKSTLLAAFLQAGHRVLTDDLLIVDRREGTPIALPGSGRIKLMPDSASAFLDDPARGTLLNPKTTKRSFPIEAARRQRTGLPLRQLFMLPEPAERDRITSIEICPISRAAMVRELLKNSFNTENLDRERLVRQFAFASQVASDVDGFRLRYPSGLHHLPALRKAIVEHVCRSRPLVAFTQPELRHGDHSDESRRQSSRI
jgi:hypothetical protein